MEVDTSAAAQRAGRNVLLAVDASDNAKYAFNWFMENVYRPNDTLIIVHCPEPPSLPSFSFKSPMTPPVHEWKERLDEMNAKTRKLEEDYEGTCIQKKLKYKICGEAMKHPGEGILRTAEQEQCTLICMGTRGLSSLKKVIIGSVSDYVIKHTDIPTIIVPSKTS